MKTNVFRKSLMRFLVWRIKYVSDNNFTLIVAGLIGITSGLAAIILKSAVHFIVYYAQLNLDIFEINYLYLLYPLIGIFLTVLLAKYVFKEELGHGITHILFSISKNSGILKKTMMYSRMLTSAITVGFGGSVGLEAPIVVTGSAIGSNLSRIFHFGYKRRTLLIGCGAAGAIASIFNSPVAGVIFAMEVILTEVAISNFIPLLIASACGHLMSIVFFGDDVLFSFRLKDAFIASDTIYYVVFGLLCGIISLYFTRSVYFFEDSIKKINNLFVRAIVGGGILAVIILLFPPIYGEGYIAIKALLNGTASSLTDNSMFNWIAERPSNILLFTFLVLCIKPAATALTIGAGGSGGIFAPSLFMGALVGYLYSTTANQLFGLSLSESNFVLVGMCGVLSGVLHAPLTAIFLIAEITSGYMLFVPLMIVSALSFSAISYFEKHSIYTKKLIEEGTLIQYDKDLIVLSLIDMKQLIEKDLLTVKPTDTLEELVVLVKKAKRNIFPVVNADNQLEGIVTLDDVREIMFDNDRRDIYINTIMKQPPAYVLPSEKMQSVMNKFEVTQAWNLPVIEDGKYLGFISKSRIFNSYRKKLKQQNIQ